MNFYPTSIISTKALISNEPVPPSEFIEQTHEEAVEKWDRNINRDMYMLDFTMKYQPTKTPYIILVEGARKDEK